MAPIIEIKNLTKAYSKRTAVDNLSLTVEEGDIYGFVGPNGAGKTSTIRILCTLLEANSGEVFVAGHSVKKNPRGVRKAIGYMPDFFGVYNDMQVWEYLDFFGACYRIDPATRARLIDDLLELVDLTHRKNDMVDKLSRGMKQRLSLARTLMHDPQVLVLDEPASGLDPRARVEIRELLLELARLGKTIFFSTHILADVAEICTRVGIIEGGKMVATGGIGELQKLVMPHRQVQLTVLNRAKEAEDLLRNIPGISAVQNLTPNGNDSRTRFEFEFIGDEQALGGLLAYLVQNNVQVIHFTEERHDLEEVFMRVTKGIVT
ncbi:MAG TPA: ABC transporter ATP-binding protein [Anaerolineales bacterium]|nr:ABC transporter ATP-binding protein [Anaerolineales bacterium]